MRTGKKQTIKNIGRVVFFTVVIILSTRTVHTADLHEGLFEPEMNKSWSLIRFENSGDDGSMIRLGIGGDARSNITLDHEIPGAEALAEHEKNIGCAGPVGFESRELSISLFYAYFPKLGRSGGTYIGGGVIGYGIGNTLNCSTPKGIARIEESYLSGLCSVFTGYAAGLDEKSLFDARLGYSHVIDEKGRVSGNVSACDTDRFSKPDHFYAQVTLVRAF